MGELITRWTLVAATLTEGFATVIIFGAALEAAVRSVLVFVNFRQDHQGIQRIRWRFGRWLALALDFLIASDILRTGVSPSWAEIGQLGATVAIRIVITIALSREVSEIAPDDRTAP